MLLNYELVSRVKLCVVSVFRYIVKDCPKMRNLPKIFLRSFENVARVSSRLEICLIHDKLRQHSPDIAERSLSCLQLSQLFFFSQLTPLVLLHSTDIATVHHQ